MSILCFNEINGLKEDMVSESWLVGLSGLSSFSSSLFGPCSSREMGRTGQTDHWPLACATSKIGINNSLEILKKSERREEEAPLDSEF